MVDKSSVKKQFQQAHELISAQKYKEARELLQQIDHPKAKEWLSQLEDKKKQSTSSPMFSPQVLLFGLAATVFILGAVIALLYAPPLLETLQPDITNQYFEDMDNIVVTDEEIFYSHVASYCYQITGYGGELCLDWADLVVAEHNNTVRDCLTPFIEYQSNLDIMATPTDEDEQDDELTNEDYEAMRNCLSDVGVPEPL